MSSRNPAKRSTSSYRPALAPRPRRRVTRRRYWRGTQRTNNVQKSTIHSLQPAKKLVRLRFSLNSGDAHALTSTAGSIASYSYRANDLYDPYAGAGGAQPRGFDQWMVFYRHFVVVGSQMVIKVFSPVPNATGEIPMRVGIVISDSTTAPTTTSMIAENPRGVSKIFGVNQVQTLVKRFSTRGFFSVNDPVDSDDLHGSSGASPTEQAVYHICAFALNAGTESCYVTGYIDYIAWLIHPIVPAQST